MTTLVPQNMIDAVLSAVSLPIAALPFPTVVTIDNKIPITVSSSVSTGGTVTVPSGVVCSIGRVVSAGVSGYSVTATTASQTIDLDVSSTYYIRGNVNSAGALVCYVQKGTDADSTPSSFVGTSGASSGGGFDSTPVDILLAKVVTTTAGTAPTITLLANARNLKASFTYAGSTSVSPTTVHTFNFARTPTLAISSFDTQLTNNVEGGFTIKIVSISRYAASIRSELHLNVKGSSKGSPQYVVTLTA